MTDMSWMPWVVGGVMVLSFLYMKVWPFVRTIIRATGYYSVILHHKNQNQNYP